MHTEGQRKTSTAAVATTCDARQSRNSNLAAAGIVSAMLGIILLQGLVWIKPRNGETAMAPHAAQPSSVQSLLRGI
jgi:hypothetical protein